MMMHHTAAEALGQARIASLRDQARRDALARAARRARRARQHPERRTAKLLTAFAGRVLRRRPAPESV